jgi:hypothetical protein
MSVRFCLIDIVSQEHLRPQSGYSKHYGAANQSAKKFKKNSNYLKIEKSNLSGTGTRDSRSYLPTEQMTRCGMLPTSVVLGHNQLVKGTTRKGIGEEPIIVGMQEVLKALKIIAISTIRTGGPFGGSATYYTLP